MNVVIVPTGTANLASVLGGLARVGAVAVVARRPQDLGAADAVVLPGVGSFAAGMAGLKAGGFVGPLRKWIRGGRPLLAVCLGLQLLARSSEEAPGVTGLGVIDAEVTRLPATVSVPQLGWNVVRGGELVTDGFAYFANSYRLTSEPVGWRAAWADHGGPLTASLERGVQLACQFHPELSAGWGHALLGRWLERAAGTAEEREAC